MASPNLHLPHIAENQNNKYITHNTDVDRIDNAGQRRLAKALSDANYTLTTSPADTAEAYNNSFFEFTGTLSAQRDIIVPVDNKYYTVKNATSGGFGLQVKTSGGSGIVVAAGKVAVLYCDGTNVIRITADV